MKVKIFASMLVAITLFFTSCFDIEEKIQINKDNSGAYMVSIDMGNILKMTSQMAGNQKDSSKVPEKKDSTIYLKSFVDTATNLSAEEKRLMRNGSLRMKVDEANNEMKLILNFPFVNFADLSRIRESYVATLNKIGALQKIGKNGNEENGEEEMPKTLGPGNNTLNPLHDTYTFSAVPGKITNKFTNKELFDKKISADSSLQMMQQMSAIMGDFNYKTIIIIPRAAKKFAGNEAQISADKKTITFHTSLTDLLNRPAAGEFELEY